MRERESLITGANIHLLTDACIHLPAVVMGMVSMAVMGLCTRSRPCSREIGGMRASSERRWFSVSGMCSICSSPRVVLTTKRGGAPGSVCVWLSGDTSACLGSYTTSSILVHMLYELRELLLSVHTSISFFY